MKRTKKIKNMKRETVTFVLSSSFPRRQCFSFSYTLANISVASQKSLEVMCCFVLVTVTAAEDGNDGNSGSPRRFSAFCLLVSVLTFVQRCHCAYELLTWMWKLWYLKAKVGAGGAGAACGKRYTRQQWPPLCWQLAHGWEKAIDGRYRHHFCTVILSECEGAGSVTTSKWSNWQMKSGMRLWRYCWDQNEGR